MTSTYLRPLARLPVGTSRVAAPSALWLGAHLHAPGFAAAEIITRSGGSTERRIVEASAVRADAAAGIRALVDRLAAPRLDIAGLSLDRPRIMGIVNVTPDSFSDGGLYLDTDAAVQHALQLEAEGAEILDIGGESTRPGAEPIDPDEECRRVIPVIERLARTASARISIDTRNAAVMERAAGAGAHILNDISALEHDPRSLAVAARTGLPVILMHMLGTPRTMQAAPRYADVVLDVYDYLAGRVAACEEAGIARARLVVDPGIGFGKTLTHNLDLLRSLSILHGLGTPVLLGASRKSFIVKLMSRIGGGEVTDRVPGSLAAALEGVQQGVQILRVHDVAATRQALAVHLHA